VLVVATGAQAKWLGLESEAKFKGFGVSACATCDAFFYRQKEVIVVGGGNTAVEEALHLTHFASKVTVVHRRDHFRAEKILQDRLFKNPKVNVLWDTELVDVIGQEGPLSVTKAKLKNLKTGEITEQPVHGIFIAIGHAPQTQLFTGQLEMKLGGYLHTAPGSTPRPFPACSLRATWPTTSSARLSPQPASVAWRRWKPRSISKACRITPRSRRSRCRAPHSIAGFLA
jgi:thioredoxin reductase (NADPH)